MVPMVFMVTVVLYEFYGFHDQVPALLRSLYEARRSSGEVSFLSGRLSGDVTREVPKLAGWFTVENPY